MSDDILHRLKEPFDKVHWRVGATNQKKVARQTGDKYAKPTKGVALAYVDSRDVMKRLDDVVGFDNWQCRYPFPGCCEVGIRIDGEWVWKANGAGDERTTEPVKSQYSDAFKRACSLWGVARYLYYLPNVWVDLDQYGKFTPPALPAWAQPKRGES